MVFRRLLKNKLYNFLSISGFAIGFAVCIVIALFAYNEYTVDHCYLSHNRIYRLYDAKENAAKIDYNLNRLLIDINPEIEAICPLEVMPDVDVNIKLNRQTVKAKGVAVVNNIFFSFFSLRVIKGSPEQPFSGRETAVITQSLAAKLFKTDENPVGQSISIDNYNNATISAVIEDFPNNTSIKADLLLNIENKDYRYSTYCSDMAHCINQVFHFMLLREGSNAHELAVKLNRDIEHYRFAVDSIGLQPLTSIYLDTEIKDNQNRKGNRNLIIVMIGVGILIMSLSTINYMNYNLSVQYAQLREIGIKRINGAGLRQLAGYCLTDVSIGMIISIDFALLIVALTLPYINGVFGKQLSLDVLLTPYMFAISVLAIILIIAINSIVPLYILSRFNVSTFFTGKRQEKGRMAGRNLLTTFQFTVAIALLCCVFIVQKQLRYAQNADLGFSKEHLLRLSLPFNFRQQQALKQEINKLPFVINSSLSNGGPGDINHWMGNGDTTENMFYLACISVDEDYLKTMNIQLVDGRWFQGGDVGTACIMNQEAIRKFGWTDFNGQRYNNGREGGYQVVGVAKDFNTESFHKSIVPTCLLSCSPERI
jgi:putative ABC transport system permease protein